MDPLLLLRPDSELLDPLDDDSDDAMWDVPTRTLGPEMTLGMYSWTFIHTTKRRADHTYIIFRLIFSKMCIFRVTPFRQVRFICRSCLDHLTEVSYVFIAADPDHTNSAVLGQALMDISDTQLNGAQATTR